MSVRVALLAFVVVGLATGSASADLIADAASRVMAAHEKGSLDTMAPVQGVDAWVLVDELLRRKAVDAAGAFARLQKGRDTAALPAYVDARAASSGDEASRAAFQQALDAIARGDPAGSLAALERVAAPPVLHVRALNGRAKLLRGSGKLKAASDRAYEAAQLAAEIGWLNEASGASQRAGHLAYLHGDLRTARRRWQFRLQVERRRGAKRAQAAALGNLGLAHMKLGNLQKALANLREAIEMFRALDLARPLAAATMNLGLVLRRLGDIPSALARYEEAQRLFRKAGNTSGEVMALANVASSLANIGEYERARALFDEVVARARKANDVNLAARAAANAAANAGNQRRFDDAHALLDKAEALLERTGARLELLPVLGTRADAFARAGRDAEAVPVYERVIALADERRDLLARAQNRAGLARAFVRLGRVEDARKILDEALRVGDRLRAPFVMIDALELLAYVHGKSGNPQGVIAAARRAVPYFERLVRGHAQSQGARLREIKGAIYQRGAVAAAALGDAAEACFFLESGRAGALLERMGGAQALFATLPDELVEADQAARDAEVAAQRAYRAAMGGGNLRRTREAAAALDRASADLQAVVERIERYQKQHAASAFVYPTATSVEEIQDRLEARDVFVIYGLSMLGCVALVVTAKDARVLSLGPLDPIEKACGRLQLVDATAEPTKAIEALRTLVVKPLALGDGARRVLLSANGALSYVPGAVLFPGREVAFQPSATTYGVLDDDRPLRGRRVLAVGDPVYAKGSGRGRMKLPPLPATRTEVEAVGDVVLVGEHATRSKLEASLAAQRRRWRAVHLACHGLVDTEQPLLSALALTPEGGDRGFLSALDVFRMTIPADLAVLSACETGRGKVYKSEGIVGLTRAFMCAGAPSVLCSLWKVDDEATQALMVKFYEYWDPKKGEGISAAAALARAQADVRAQPRWKHPYYWAAWVLWGLP